MNPKNKNQWFSVKEALRLQNKYSFKIAIIETNRIFLDFIKSKGFKVNDCEDALLLLKSEFDSPEKLEESINIFKKIIKAEKIDIDYEKTKNIVTNYYQAMLNINEESKVRLLWFKYFKQKANKFYKYLLSKIGFLAGTFLLFVLITVILKTTSFGENFVSFADMFFFTIIPVIFLVSAIVIMIIGAYMFYSKKSKVNIDKLVIEDFDEDN